MNTALIAVALGFVVVAATMAVLCREPVRQAVLLGVLGLGLAVLFTVLQAPDVALSQLAVGTVLTPLLILLTVRKVTRRAVSAPSPAPDGGSGSRPGSGSGNGPAADSEPGAGPPPAGPRAAGPPPAGPRRGAAQ